MAYTSTHGGEAPENDQSGDEKLLEDAHARFELAKQAEIDIRALALEDKKFRAGEQWPDEIRRAREQARRPCLTINKAPQFVQQITNDQRQNRPSIKVHPVDEKADIETAKIYQGLIRHIEVNSAADSARDNAFEGAVTGGFGYYRIVTQYVSPMSFDQEILVKRIANEFSAMLDPFCREPDGSDAEWGFVFEEISKDEYARRYPKSKLAQVGEWDVYGKTSPDWVNSDGCRIAEYFYKEYETKDLCLLSTGEVCFKEELEEMLAIKASQGVQAELVQERTAQIPKVKWCKLNGAEVLEATDWPGQYIPIIPVYGQELNIEGKRILEGVIRHAKDPARMYNYWASAETEAIALAPKAPFIADAKSIEGFEHMWENANTANYSYLPYNARPDVPMPQRQFSEPAVQAITQARMLAADDMKSTTGLFDAARGAQSNETSGKAILARANQAQTGNFHFTDNLTRAIRHEGRIMLDLIPKIYDTARAARILGEDGEPEIIRINEEFERNGEKVTYNLGVGKYDVTVATGPSYASKRQEGAEAMLQLSQSIPAIGQSAPDLVLKSLDVPGAQEMAERLKKTLPPNLIDDPKSKSPLPPEVQAQMQQMSQMLEQLTSKLNEAQDAIAQKRVELESKERIEFAKIEANLEIERAKLDAKDGLALLNAQIAQIENRLGLLSYGQPIQDVTQEDPASLGDGAYGAGPEMAMNPTGGESPGQPMEGTHVDPSTL